MVDSGHAIDAIPDLSDVQVIIMTDWEGRSPTLVEDQVTYPIVTSLLSAPNVKVVRGFSYFDVSFVYVIFEDGTDPYWARTRVLEYMSAMQGRLPEGVRPQLGPDATRSSARSTIGTCSTGFVASRASPRSRPTAAS